MEKVKKNYNNLSEKEIKFIEKWSWQGFFGNFVYAFGNKLYGWGIVMLVLLYGTSVGLLNYLGIGDSYGLRLPSDSQSIIFLVNAAALAVAIMFGLKGSEMSWKKGNWGSFELFYGRQKKIALATVTELVILFGLATLLILNA